MVHIMIKMLKECEKARILTSEEVRVILDGGEVWFVTSPKTKTLEVFTSVDKLAVKKHAKEEENRRRISKGF